MNTAREVPVRSREVAAMTRLANQWTRWRGPCRSGHVWTERAYPVACSRCGRSRGRAEVRF